MFCYRNVFMFWDLVIYLFLMLKIWNFIKLLNCKYYEEYYVFYIVKYYLMGKWNYCLLVWIYSKC